MMHAPINSSNPIKPVINLAIGLGCDRGTPLATLEQAVAEALALANVAHATSQVVAAASITLKADEPALLALAALHGWAMIFYTPEQLAVVPVPHPSETVRRFTGTPSVSEAAALLAASSYGHALDAVNVVNAVPCSSALVVEKHKLRGPDGKNATVSLARVAFTFSS